MNNVSRAPLATYKIDKSTILRINIYSILTCVLWIFILITTMIFQVDGWHIVSAITGICLVKLSYDITLVLYHSLEIYVNHIIIKLPMYKKTIKIDDIYRVASRKNRIYIYTINNKKYSFYRWLGVDVWNMAQMCRCSVEVPPAERRFLNL